MYLDDKREGEVRPKTDVQKIILEAADLIERSGWCQNVGINARDEYCILGAVGTVVAKLPLLHNAQLDLCLRVDELVRDATGALSTTGWNDKPGRTKEEVLRVMRSAAGEA